MAEREWVAFLIFKSFEFFEGVFVLSTKKFESFELKNLFQVRNLNGLIRCCVRPFSHSPYLTLRCLLVCGY